MSIAGNAADAGDDGGQGCEDQPDRKNDEKLVDSVEKGRYHNYFLC